MSKQFTPLRHHHLPVLAVLLGVALFVLLVLWYTAAAGQTARSMEELRQALATVQDLAKGRAMYRKECASCHGRSGHGDDKLLIPALAGQLREYTLKQLIDIGEGDRNNLRMDHVLARAQFVDVAALANVAAYVATLPVNRRPSRGSSDQLPLGRDIYGSTCAQCHGVDGDGNASWFVPALRGQHYSYVLNQMRQLGAKHRYAVEPEVGELLESMSLAQLSAVADAVSRLPEPKAD